MSRAASRAGSHAPSTSSRHESSRVGSRAGSHVSSRSRADTITEGALVPYGASSNVSRAVSRVSSRASSSAVDDSSRYGSRALTRVTRARYKLVPSYPQMNECLQSSNSTILPSESASQVGSESTLRGPRRNSERVTPIYVPVPVPVAVPVVPVVSYRRPVAPTICDVCGGWEGLPRGVGYRNLCICVWV